MLALIPLILALATSRPALVDVNRPLNFRPQSADQTALHIANLHIHDIADSKGINITPTARRTPPNWHYRTISIRNCLLERINRSLQGETQGLHTDFIRIAGDGDRQAHGIDLLLEDVTLRDGNSLPLLIQDGWFASVTLRRVRIANTTVSAQIAAINTGRFDRIVIDDCPGLRVALMGRPGSIGDCLVLNSPEASASDVLTKFGRSGATIRIQNDPPLPPATAPTTRPAISATRPADDRDITIGGRRYRVIDLD